MMMMMMMKKMTEAQATENESGRNIRPAQRLPA